MSSNTTFSSQGNFNRPEINKLKPQKDIVNIIILCSTFILLFAPTPPSDNSLETFNINCDPIVFV